MGLLGSFSRKKQTEQTPETPKTDLRIYLESILKKAESIKTENVSFKGIPINPMVILPIIVKQISDDMLENIADMLLIVSDDIKTIRAKRAENQVKLLTNETI